MGTDIVLNLGAGRCKPLRIYDLLDYVKTLGKSAPTLYATDDESFLEMNKEDKDFKETYMLVNVDRIYELRSSDINHVAIRHASKLSERKENQSKYCRDIYSISQDIRTFLDTYPEKFDRIVIYRYLEHVPMNDVLYFIYQLSQVVKSGGYVDIIVPNYAALAHRLLSLKMTPRCVNKPEDDIMADLILINSEMVNEPDDPHQFVTTPEIVRYFFELEGRFKLKVNIPEMTYDQRDIYMRQVYQRV